MALINCPFCGKKISEKAVRCPHCGIDFNLWSKEDMDNAAKRNCEECGASLIKGMESCPQCGWPIPDSFFESVDINSTDINKEKADSAINQENNDPEESEDKGKVNQIEEKREEKAVQNITDAADKSQKFSGKKIIGLIIGIVIVAAVAFFGTAKMRTYSSAQKAISAGEYLEAIAYLEQIKGYKDADLLLEQSWMDAARSYAKENKYDEALEALANIPDYEGVDELQKEYKYNLAISLMQKKDYASAHDYLKEIPGYNDADDQDQTCLHMIDVQNDKQAPVISGIKDSLEVTCGTEFNIKEYLDKNIKIEDNVSKDIKDYEIKCDSDLYVKESGKVKTGAAEDLVFTISVTDEAENKAEKELTVSLKPIHVTKENKRPVIYDGEFAKITLSGFKHGDSSGEQGYQFLFEVTNKTEESLIVYLTRETFIKDYQIPSYYVITAIEPGKTGIMESGIYEEDIPDSITDYNQIDSNVGMAYEDAEKSLYSVPTIFDVDAAE